MEMLYYTLAAIILYVVSDYILNSIEFRMGKRLPNRSFVFFIIITILALVSFSVIRTITFQPNAIQQTTDNPGKQAEKESDSTKTPPIVNKGDK